MKVNNNPQTETNSSKQLCINGQALKGAVVNVLELFSGIGGFSKGLIEAGFEIKKHNFSEIDKHAIANFKYNFKNAESIGSVTDIRGDEIERPNIITFGSPCQDFSLAGKRKGMEGQRSSLILHAIRLIRECRPDFFIWENVKGAYSSNNGADFWGIIQAFINIRGYRLEWQLLNTSWFLPQNRERVYLIGHLAKNGGGFGGVFPITENDFISDEQKKSSSRQPQAKNSTALRAGGSLKADDTFIELSKIARALTCGGNSGGLHSDMQTIPICVAQRGRNPENPSDRTTGVNTEQRLEPNSKGIINALTSVQKDNLIMIHSNTKKGFEEVEKGDSINFSNPSSKTRRGRVGKGKAQTLDTACNQGVIEKRNYLQWDTSGKGYNSQQDRAFYEEGNMGCIPSTRTENKINVLANSNIRRLTEIECERLQGFPDNWTEFGNYDGKIKPIPKTQRYKMLGNAVTVDVVKAIGHRLLTVGTFETCR